jgi:hypothetical protein
MLELSQAFAGSASVRRGLLAASLLCLASPALAQVIPPTIPQQPRPPAVNSPLPPSAASASLPASSAPTAVEADPARIFGDDAPFLSGLDVLAGIGLDVAASLRTEYSDNMLRRPDNATIQPDESRADFVFRPNVTVNAGRAFGRQQLFVNTAFGWDIYARNDQLNGSRFLLNGGLAWTLGQRCNGRVQGGISTRVTQFDQFAEVVPSRQKRSNFLASATCQTAGGLAPTVSYTSAKARNTVGTTSTGQTVDRSFADVNSQGLSGGIGYSISNRGQVGAQFAWTDVEYPNQLLLGGEPNGTEITNWSLYGNYRIGSSLTVNGSIGSSNAKPKSGLTQPFKGTIWSAGVNYGGPRLGAAVSAGRNVSGSNGGDSNYQISDFLNGTVTYRLNNRVDLATGYARTKQQNRGFIGVPIDTVILEGTTERIFAGADYRLNRILSFGLDVKHLKRVSRPNTFSYDANSVLFSVRAAF